MALSPPDNDEPIKRADWLADQVSWQVEKNKPGFVFLEKPPDTIYHQGRMSPGQLIARAQNVFKVVGVTYSLYTRISSRFPQVSLFLIDPVKWQERSSKARQGLEIKEWSLKLANSLIVAYGNAEANLHTKRDENIADAIAMGHISYNSGFANI